MVDRVTNQAGDASIAANWTPSGVPVSGDRISVNHAMTNFSGTVGDLSTAVAITLNAGGSLTLGGAMQTEGAGDGILFNGGSLIQGAYLHTHAPTVNGTTALTYSGTAGHVQTHTANGPGLVFSNVNGATSATALNRPDGTSDTWVVNWPNYSITDFGDGVAVRGATISLGAVDTFSWQGGRFVRNGQLNLNFKYQDISFDVDSVAIGMFVGADYVVGANNSQPIYVQNFPSAPTVTPKMTNCLVYDSTPNTRYQILFGYAIGIMDISGSRFINYGYDNSNGNPAPNDYSVLIADDVSVWRTAGVLGTDQDINVGIRDRSGNVSMSRATFVGNKESGLHLPTITGDVTELVYNDWIFDGCGINSNNEIGDQPIINSGTVKLVRPIYVHHAGGPQPSLSGSTGTFKMDRGTFHQAANILGGELAANPNAWGAMKNNIFSAPYKGRAFVDGGGLMPDQNLDDIDYNAFIISEMDVTNVPHPQYANQPGYFGADVLTHAAYGLNDIAITNFQFTDSTRQAKNWAGSLGYTADLAGLEQAILANFGIDSNGDVVAPDVNASPAAYRTYVTDGYTSSNAADLLGAGLAGVDIGAVAISSSNQTPVVATPIPDQTDEEVATISLDVSANFSDPDVADTLTFSDPTGSLPAGLTISAAGVISGTINIGEAVGSPHSVTIRATDSGTPTAFVEDTFTWTVTAVATLSFLSADTGNHSFVDTTGAQITNISGLHWAVFAGQDVGAFAGAPISAGVNGVIDGAGEMVLALSGASGLTPGDPVTVLIHNASWTLAGIFKEVVD